MTLGGAVLGGIAFSRLIKTFLPGLILTIALLGYFDLFRSIVSPSSATVIGMLFKNTALAVTVIVPASLFMGLISNMAVFLWGERTTPRVPAQVRHHMTELVQFEDRLKAERWQKIRAEEGWPAQPEGALGDDARLLNIDYLLHPAVTGERLEQLANSYWYYIEFQRNSTIAIALASPLLMVATVKGFATHGWITTTIATGTIGALLAALLTLLVRSAGQNAYQFQRRRVSLLLAGTAQLTRGDNKDGI